MTAAERIDVVYTWVDDRFPGYAEQLAAYAGKPQDRNPNRTRDNLDLLKYGLRSLVRFVPWVGNIHIVSCAPQIPSWLDRQATALRIVHHDAFIPAEFLPTFNSFAIVSYLADLPGLSRRFLYIEDDMLFGRPATLSDFADDAFRLRFLARLQALPRAKLFNRDDISPWNASLGNTNRLLTSAFGQQRRSRRATTPLFIDSEIWNEMLSRWPSEFLQTRMSRFRSKHNVVPEYLYPHYLLHTHRAFRTCYSDSYREAYYFPLENSLILARLHVAAVRRLRPKFLTLNDGFGEAPNPRVVALARQFLEETYPEKSRFEL